MIMEVVKCVLLNTLVALIHIDSYSYEECWLKIKWNCKSTGPGVGGRQRRRYKENFDGATNRAPNL
jgi:hypothetical protein